MCCLGAIYSILTCGEDKEVAFVRNNKPTKVITPEHQIGTELRRSHNAEVIALYPSPPNNKLIYQLYSQGYRGPSIRGRLRCACSLYDWPKFTQCTALGHFNYPVACIAWLHLWIVRSSTNLGTAEVSLSSISVKEYLCIQQIVCIK